MSDTTLQGTWDPDNPGAAPAKQKPPPAPAPEKAPWGMLRAGTGKTATGQNQDVSPGAVASSIGEGLVTAPMVPSQAALTVLGAPMRATMNRTAHPETQSKLQDILTALGPAGWAAGMADPKARQRAGNDVYAIFHPNDERIENEALQKSGADALLPKPGQAKPIHDAITRLASMPTLHGTMSPDQAKRVADTLTPLIQKSQDFATRTGFEVAQDPLTLATGVTEDVSKRLFGAYDKAIQDAMKARAAGTASGLQKGWLKWGASDMKSREMGFYDSFRPQIRTVINAANTNERIANDAAQKFVKPIKDKVQRQRTLDNMLKQNADDRRITVKQNLRAIGVSKKGATKLAQRTTEPENFLGNVSKWRTNSMLFFGLPHARNVGIAGWMAGGSGLIADAVNMFGNVPAALERDLAKGGASHFSESSPMAKLLNDWDLSVRAARLKQLGWKDGMKDSDLRVMLDRVNQDIGTYNKDIMPGIVDWSHRIGGQFQGWRMMNVPGMFMRATLRNPGRMRRLFSAEQNFNDDFVPEGQRLNLGGPADEGAEALAAGPIGAYKYVTGPSVIGPWNQLVPTDRTVKNIEQGRAIGPSDILSGIRFLSSLHPIPMITEQAAETGLNMHGEPGAGIAGTLGRFGLNEAGLSYGTADIYSLARKAAKLGEGGFGAKTNTTDTNKLQGTWDPYNPK